MNMCSYMQPNSIIVTKKQDQKRATDAVNDAGETDGPLELKKKDWESEEGRAYRDASGSKKRHNLAGLQTFLLR